MRRITGLVVSTALTAAGMVAVASPAWAACGLGANNPVSGSGVISGTGSRTDCGGTVTLTVRVRKDVFGPDINAAEIVRANFSNGSLTASGSCRGNGSYFTETLSSSGNKISSGRVNRC